MCILIEVLVLLEVGVFVLVLEYIKVDLVKEIIEKVFIFIIGIGVGVYCDG